MFLIIIAFLLRFSSFRISSKNISQSEEEREHHTEDMVIRRMAAASSVNVTFENGPNILYKNT